MNNKGQSLVLFICLLPVLIVLFAYLFDTAYIAINDNKLNSVAEIGMEYINSGKDVSSVKKVILSNDSEIIISNVSLDNIHLKKEIKPIFGQIIGYEKYNLEVNLNK